MPRPAPPRPLLLMLLLLEHGQGEAAPEVLPYAAAGAQRHLRAAVLDRGSAVVRAAALLPPPAHRVQSPAAAAAAAGRNGAVADLPRAHPLAGGR